MPSIRGAERVRVCWSLRLLSHVQVGDCLEGLARDCNLVLGRYDCKCQANVLHDGLVIGNTIITTMDQ